MTNDPPAAERIMEVASLRHLIIIKSKGFLNSTLVRLWRIRYSKFFIPQGCANKILCCLVLSRKTNPEIGFFKMTRIAIGGIVWVKMNGQ
jgi:hypothetical protein